MRWRSWLLILVMAGLFGLVAYEALLATAEAGKGLPAYSVYSSEADGLAEAGRVLRKLGFEPVAVTRPIRHTRYKGLLILVEPVRPNPITGEDQPGLAARDARALLDWVGEDDNTLVLIGKNQTPLHELLGVSIHRGKDVEGQFQAAEALPVPYYTEPATGFHTQPVLRVGVEGTDTLQAPKGLPLWTLSGGTAAVVVQHGKGKAVVVADPSLWTHRGLLRNDNVLFLYNVASLDAAGRRVYFDEYHHGLHSGGGYWDYLRYHDLHWNVLQLLALAAVVVWGAAVRLGPPVPRPKPARADAVDYASAAARIYQRAGVRDLLAQHMVRDFLEALAYHLRLRRTALPAQLLAEWRLRHGKESAERLQELLRGAVDLRRAASGASRDIPENDLFTWSRAFDEFLRDNGLTRQGGPLPGAKRR